jgi:hypothetical protein
MIPKSEKNILHFEKHEVKNSTSKPPPRPPNEENILHFENSPK